MTPTARALLATVRANPGDTTARMVYADALEEAGDEVGAQIQRAIAEPHNDGHRLALADALERTAGEVACPQAGYAEGERHHLCARCQGRGRVSDGRKEWSEFVKVQCRIAAYNPRDCNQGTCNTAGYGPCAACREIDALRARERELWPAVQPFFRTMGCETVIDPNHYRSGNGARHPWVVVSRGLPSVVRCTLAKWLGEPCEHCQGRGHRTLYGDGSGPWAKCQYCIDGRAPGIGPQLAQAWPLVRVEVTDAVIHPSGGNSTYYVGGLGIFPKEFWRRLEGHRTPSAARAALSDATIAWARAQPLEVTT